MKTLEKILPVLNKATPLGIRTLSNGSQLIGHVPHVAPEAWLHEVYAPLTENDIKKIEIQIGRQVPSVFADFLKSANGLKLFSGSLSIDGLRVNYSRKGDASRQPFDIQPPNTIERPRDAEESYVFIGGYNWDASQLYIDSRTLKVFRSETGNCQPLNEWDSFEEMLVAETMRISEFFDREGRKIDPKKSTTPT